MLFVVTTIAIVLVIWQQRRAEHMAAVQPDDVGEPFAGTPAFPPAPGAAGG
jgi:hypothetical protein